MRELAVHFIFKSSGLTRGDTQWSDTRELGLISEARLQTSC